MNKGFTLIELLVVVLIIGILSAVALPQYSTAIEKSRAVEALSLMSAVATSAERYRLQKDVWPTTNTFNQLDIEVPKYDATHYGGKSFEITMGGVGNDSTANSFYVIAKRRLSDANSKYSLKTVVTEEADGTFSVTRCCTKVLVDSTASCIGTDPTDTTTAGKFCNAITSGHTGDF